MLLLYCFIHLTEHQFCEFNSSGPSPYANKWWQSESKSTSNDRQMLSIVKWVGWNVRKEQHFFCISINLRNIRIQIEGGYWQIYRFIYFIKNNSALFKRFIIVIRLICSFQAQQRTLNICFIMFFFFFAYLVVCLLVNALPEIRYLCLLHLILYINNALINFSIRSSSRNYIQ